MYKTSAVGGRFVIADKTDIVCIKSPHGASLMFCL